VFPEVLKVKKQPFSGRTHPLQLSRQPAWRSKKSGYETAQLRSFRGESYKFTKKIAGIQMPYMHTIHASRPYFRPSAPVVE
jgi:hypothetical protein